MQKYEAKDDVTMPGNQSEIFDIAEDYPVNITIRVDRKIYKKLTSYVKRQSSTIKDVAGEAITYWILFLAKEAEMEAMGGGVDQAKKNWLAARRKRFRNKRVKARKTQIKSRRSWALANSGRPWPGVKALGNQSKGDVQMEVKTA